MLLFWTTRVGDTLVLVQELPLKQLINSSMTVAQEILT